MESLCPAKVATTPQLQIESKRCDTATVFVSAAFRAGFRCQSAQPVSHHSQTLRFSVAVGKTKPAGRYERTINNRRSSPVWCSSPQRRRWSVWLPTLISAESPRGTEASLLSASCLANYVFDTTSAGSCARVTSNATDLSQQTANSGSNLLHRGATLQAVNVAQREEQQQNSRRPLEQIEHWESNTTSCQLKAVLSPQVLHIYFITQHKTGLSSLSARLTLTARSAKEPVCCRAHAVLQDRLERGASACSTSSN